MFEFVSENYAKLNGFLHRKLMPKQMALKLIQNATARFPSFFFFTMH